MPSKTLRIVWVAAILVAVASSLKRHAKTLWAVDFFSVKAVTAPGFRDMYVMVWLCMTSREVIVSESTEHPNSAWVEKQADWFVDQAAGRDAKPDIIMHVKDTTERGFLL